MQLDGQKLENIPAPEPKRKIWFGRGHGRWEQIDQASPALKGPHRYGPFKEAFYHRMRDLVEGEPGFGGGGLLWHGLERDERGICLGNPVREPSLHVMTFELEFVEQIELAGTRLELDARTND